VRLALLALALAACGAPRAVAPVLEACVVPTSAGTHVTTCRGLRFDVTIPAACPPAGCGLVLDVPGLSMTGKMEDENTHLRALAPPRGYVVVQPTARPASKGRGLDLPNPRWPVWARGDDEHVFAFVQAAIARLGIDRARVHATGFSMGAMVTWKLLCGHAEVFASVAPAAGTAGCSFVGKELPAREVPILFLHGHSDLLVPFYAASERRAAVVKAWGMHERQSEALDAHARRTVYASAAGTEFVFVDHHYASPYKADLGGHCFPGSKDAGLEPDQLLPFGCAAPNAFAWGEIVLAFFETHPRR